MMTELVRHYERYRADNDNAMDWQSPNNRTQIVKYGTRASLYNVLNQDPQAIAAEYQLNFYEDPVFTWCEYRWPHLLIDKTAGLNRKIDVPSECLEDLMNYHIAADTSWLHRYRAGLERMGVAKIKKVGIVAELDRVELL